MIARLVYGPPDWLVVKFSARDRRAFGFWNIVFAAIGSIFFGSRVWWVTVLSVIALFPNYTAETPVVSEAE